MSETQGTPERLSTGVEGLDEILNGGLIPGRGYLIRGPPGTGKTILGLHVLQEGIEQGETGLMISLEQREEDLRQDIEGLGLGMEDLHVLDVTHKTGTADAGDSYDVFEPDEVEGEEIGQIIDERIEETDPDRVFLDPVTVLRYLSPDAYQFRKRVLGLTRSLREHDATLVMASQAGPQEADADLQFVTDGTIGLGYRGEFRTISVPKFRGSATASGSHTFRIGEGGIQVFPDLKPGPRIRGLDMDPIPSGVPELDEMLHGGIERGTATIISGPTGVGKTTLGTQFMKEAAERGEFSSIYLFEESQDTFLARSEAIGVPIGDMLDRGTLQIHEIEALEHPPEELAQMMRRDVEEDDARIVMIDGLAGIRIATGGDMDALLPKMHALTRFLKNNGVTVLLIDQISELHAGFQATGSNLSYLGDNVVVLRHMELDGELRKIVGVLKKRVSDFERQLRELQITSKGLKVGEPLTGLRGVLTGNPQIRGERQESHDRGDL